MPQEPMMPPMQQMPPMPPQPMSRRARSKMTSDKNHIIVTVAVITYNQEQWIRQTLDSILSQQTDYPYEVIIGEDYSTDGTRAICQAYADKYENVILLPSVENLGVTANWVRCVQAGSGKYIMNCAGDDYWHNPNKIQLQVDFMEKHLDCVLCHTDIDELHEKTGALEKNVKRAKGIIPPEGRIQRTILNGSASIAAVTQCIRRDAFDRYVHADEFARRRFPREDWPTQLVLSAYGDILYIPESTATYRIGQESITRTSDYEKIIKRAQQDKEMTKYLYTLFPEWGPFNDEEYFDTIGYHNALLAAYRNNDYLAAQKYAKSDKFPSKATYMAKTWVTFKIYRLWRMRRNTLL